MSIAFGIDVALSGEQFVFDTGREIWIANIDGTGAVPIAEGRAPAWQPF